MSRSPRLPVSLALLVAVGALASPARARDEPAWVRVVPVAASGERAPEQPPEVAPALAPFAALLRQLHYAAYAPLVSDPPRRAVPAGERTTFAEAELGVRYAVSVAWAPKGEGRMELDVEVTRPKPPPEEGRERVVSLRVPVADGGDCVVRCVDALDQADLVLILSAGRELR